MIQKNRPRPLFPVALAIVLHLVPAFSSAQDASMLEHWKWLSEASEKNSEVPREQLLEYYDANLPNFDLDSFEWDPPEYNPINIPRALFGLSTAARRTGDPREDSFLQHANRFADQEIQSKFWLRKATAPFANREFLEDARDDREFELVFQESHRMNERVRIHLIEKGFDESYFNQGGSFDPRTFSSGNKVVAEVAAELGDYSKLLQFARSEVERMEAVVERTNGTKDISKLDPQQGFLIMLKYPDLALALARNGNGEKAAQVLDEYEQFMTIAASNQSAKNVHTFGGAFESTRQLALAETNLILGRPEAALDSLPAVSTSYDKGMQDFSNYIGGSKGIPEKMKKAFDSKKRKLEEQILEIRIACLWQLGRYDVLAENLDSYSSLLKSLPPTHPKVMSIRQLQLWTQLALGNREAAVSEIQEFSKNQTAMIEEAFQYASERQRLALMEQLDLFSLLIATDRSDLLFHNIVSLKGIVLDSILEDRKVLQRETSPEVEELLALLEMAQNRLANAQASQNLDEATLARNEVERLETRLSQVSSFQVESRKGLRVTLEDIQSALSPGETVLEYIRYQRLVEPGKMEEHYGVAIIPAEGEPTWFVLGNAVGIDENISTFKKRMDPSQGQFDDTAIESVLKTLYRQLLAPAEATLADNSKLYLCPDSELGGLAFATLLDAEGAFASEKWELAFVSTSRDLLKETTEPTGESSLFIVANPDFASPPDTSSGTVDLASRAVRFDISGIPPLAPLPGTQQELEAITAIAGELNATVTSLSGTEARESALGQWDTSPTFFHFATHGLVLPAVASVTNAEGKQATGNFATADNALQRSMLALAGATATFAQWKEGLAPDSRDDGLLNAAEVAGLNLDDTWITVLSACDTGTGEALSGEGVFGLRRGFLMAGSDHLVMTFWPIADQQTVEIMTDFYRKLGEDQHPASALHQAQVEKLKEWREEMGLGAAVYLAGPFALSTSGDRESQPASAAR